MERDAYQDDMLRFLRMSDEDVERLFRGVPPERDEDLRDVAEFLASVPQALSRSPRSDVEARHLALMTAVASARPDGELSVAAPATSPPITRSSHRRGSMRLRTVRWGLKVAIATGSIVLMTAALAFAGVDLPGTAAETAFQNVLGVQLPNQAEEHAGTVPEELPETAADTANAVLDAIREWRSGADWNGCELGAAVSAAARGLEASDTSHCASGASEAAGGSQHGTEGPGSADEAASAAASAGASHAQDGLDTADEASDGSAPVGFGSP